MKLLMESVGWKTMVFTLNREYSTLTGTSFVS